MTSWLWHCQRRHGERMTLRGEDEHKRLQRCTLKQTSITTFISKVNHPIFLTTNPQTTQTIKAPPPLHQHNVSIHHLLLAASQHGRRSPNSLPSRPMSPTNLQLHRQRRHCILGHTRPQCSSTNMRLNLGHHMQHW